MTTHEYDANGRETAIVDALGHRTETTYDAAGRVRTAKNADGKVTENVYDALGQLVRTIDPTGAAVDYTVDDAGFTTRIDISPSGRCCEVSRQILSAATLYILLARRFRPLIAS